MLRNEDQNITDLSLSFWRTPSGGNSPVSSLNSVWKAHRSRLISLWEIMKPFHVDFFLRMSTILGLLDMKGKLHELRSNDSNYLNDPLDDENQRASLNDLLTLLESDCTELGLIASRATVGKLKSVLAQGKGKNQALFPLGEVLQDRLIDEMEGKSFLALTSGEAEYYNNPRKGWEDILERFPDTISDIEEAYKCFALSRYAASIFHSLQIVEVGLIELGKFIQVADPKSGWTAVANELSRIIKKNYNDRTDFEKQNFAFLEQVHGTVEALKNAWRNKISHVQGKLILLTKDFSPDIAEEILFASRAFMRRLADGLPLPSASP
jgi:hypothetical protein